MSFQGPTEESEMSRDQLSPLHRQYEIRTGSQSKCASSYVFKPLPPFFCEFDFCSANFFYLSTVVPPATVPIFSVHSSTSPPLLLHPPHLPSLLDPSSSSVGRHLSINIVHLHTQGTPRLCIEEKSDQEGCLSISQKKKIISMQLLVPGMVAHRNTRCMLQLFCINTHHDTHYTSTHQIDQPR